MNVDLELLKKYNIKAKKGLGQNFLVNNDIIKNIANTLDIEGKDIIEIGPGYGALTEELIKKRPKKLTLIELDSSMVDILNMRIKNQDFNLNGIDFKIENMDVLEYDTSFFTRDYFVIANIPYYITSPILRRFLYDVVNSPKKMLILMQRDVALRILGKKSSVLSLFVQKKCVVKEVLFVGKENFVPSPKVESSVLLFEIHNLYQNIDDKQFLEFIKKGFKEPRKKLLKNLINAGYAKDDLLKIFQKFSLDENVRGEDLGIEIWCELFGECRRREER